MSDRAELICRMMVELGAEFERLAEATTRQQRPARLNAKNITDIASACEGTLQMAKAAKFLAMRTDVN